MNAIYDLIDQYINYLIVEKGLADATIESYSGDLKKFADCLKSEKVWKNRRDRHCRDFEVPDPAAERRTHRPVPGAASGDAQGLF
ncbi:MAG: site-specific integrase [Desulfobacterales bacterium]